MSVLKGIIPKEDALLLGGYPAKIFEAVDATPTIDVVPVVRCKDCKHRPIDTGGHNYGQDLFFPDEDNVCPCQCGDQWYSWMPGDDWFCANGERVEQISAEFAKLMREGEIRVRWRDGET